MRSRYLGSASLVALSGGVASHNTAVALDERPGEIKLFPVEYDKALLATVHEDERVLHFMMQQIANDVSSLQRLLLYYLQETPEEPIESRAARTGVAVMLLRFLSGRLYEAWNVLDDPRHARVRGSYLNDMTSEAKEAFETIKRYFKSSACDVLKRVRHDIAFHTDIDTMKAAYAAHPEDERFVDLLAKDVGNTFYDGASNLVARAITHVAGESTLVAGVGKLIDESIKVSRALMQYAQGFELVFVHRHIDPKWEMVRERATVIRNIPRMVDVSAPYFATGSPKDIRRESA